MVTAAPPDRGRSRARVAPAAPAAVPEVIARPGPRPPPGRLGRLRSYLSEMFPLPRHLLLAALLGAGAQGFLARASGLKASPLSGEALVGMAGLFLMMLILRLMDELKDQEIDRRLFRARPLPAGRVLASDLRAALAAACALYLALNAWGGGALWMAAVVLGYAGLMFRWFFAPERLRHNLLLTLATHNPIIPLMVLHLVVLFAAARGLGPAELPWRFIAPFCALFWGAFAAWEISRKIRSPQEEGEYVTYSKVLGPRGAVLAAAGCQGVSLAAGAWLWAGLSLSPSYLAALGAGFAAALVGHARFLAEPCPATSRLKPFAEAFVLTLLLAHCWEFAA